MNERRSASRGTGWFLLLAAVAAVSIQSLVEEARATHQPFAFEEKCQLALGRSLGKYARDRARCIASCYADAVTGSGVESDCLPPFAGHTHECVERAEERLDRGFYYPECYGHCPGCYGCNGTGDAHFDNVEATRVAETESWVDGAMAAVFCDDSGSADGLTPAEVNCRRTIADAIGRFAKAKANCLYKCRKAEAQGKVDATVCQASSPSHPAAAACIADARADGLAQTAGCADPPECLAPILATILGMVDAGMDALDGDVHCSVPLACGDTFGPQCDGACPMGLACTNVSGQCVCQASVLPCGTAAGAPACWGTCPPEAPICHDDGGMCLCANR